MNTLSRILITVGVVGWLAAGARVAAQTNPAEVAQRTAEAPAVPVSDHEAAPHEAAILAAELEEALRALAQENIAVAVEGAGGLAIEAVVRSLDPAARLLSAEQAEHLRAEWAGRDYGLPVRLSMTNGQPVVIEVYPPTEATPLQSGDVLMAVNEAATTNTTLPGALALVRGDGADPLRVILRRADQVITVETTRVQVELGVVEVAEKWARDLAYLKLNGLFSSESAQAVVSLLHGWDETGRYGIILDLRGAGGNDLGSVVSIGSLFAEAGSLLFALRDRDDQDVAVYKASAGDPLDKPMLVLVDEATTGASEVLAAVVGRSGRGVMIMGTATAGDPRIRDILELPGGRLIYLATRKLATADGLVLDGRAGLAPDSVFTHPGGPADFYEPPPGADRRATLDEERADRALRDRIRGDVLLRQAVDLLVGCKALNIRVGAVSSGR